MKIKTAHELAHELLKLPKDAVILYLEEDSIVYTRVKNIKILRNGVSKEAELHEKINQQIEQGLTPSTYVVLNPKAN